MMWLEEPPAGMRATNWQALQAGPANRSCSPYRQALPIGTTTTATATTTTAAATTTTTTTTTATTIITTTTIHYKV
jgi:hypothetical protein